jgi:Na+-driven multidrug efflux pump
LLSQNIQISSFYLYLSSFYSITTIPLIHLFLHLSLQGLYSLFLCLYIQNITEKALVAVLKEKSQAKNSYRKNQ